MNFIYALFFVGAGDVQPIDTGYRFESRLDCTTFLLSASARAADPFSNWVDENGDYTNKAKESSQTARIDFERRVSKTEDEYHCVLHK